MGMRVIYFMLPVVAIFLVSCGGETQLKDGDTIFFPDTAAFIRDWNIEEQQMRADLFTKDSLYNQLPFDTIELTYSMCDCPDWIDRTKGDIDCKECTDFYIESADTSLTLPDAIFVSGATTVRFYGVMLPGMNLPQGRSFYTSDPVEWTVFRYYGYEILRPYTIWGPQYKEFQAPGDTLTGTVQLRIR